MSKKLLILHAGGPKTGSSALQNFLEYHAETLAERGFSYAHRVGIASCYQVTSGNGIPLLKALGETSATPDEELEQLIDSYFSGLDRAICSSELFVKLSEEGWSRLSNACEKTGIELRILFYVRNVVPSLLSAYDQEIKRHGEWRDFAEWLERSRWVHADTLRVLVRGVGAEAIEVVHYDAHSQRLIESFLHRLGLAGAVRVDRAFSERRVNRSLTEPERAILRAFNKEFEHRFSMELSDLMLASDPERPTAPIELTNTILRRIRARFEADVGWVNETFFRGRPIVAVTAGSSFRRKISGVLFKPFLRKQNQAETVEMRILQWAIRKLKTAQRDARYELLLTLKNARLKAKEHPDLPEDFDAGIYLLLNADVTEAGVDPVAHYLEYGKKEGRRYRLPQEDGAGSG